MSSINILEKRESLPPLPKTIIEIEMNGEKLKSIYISKRSEIVYYKYKDKYYEFISNKGIFNSRDLSVKELSEEEYEKSNGNS